MGDNHKQPPSSKKCKLCDHYAETKRSLYTHVLNEHLAECQFICQTCNQVFRSKLAYCKHNCPLRSNRLRHVCNLCKKRRIKDMKQHVIACHTNEKALACIYCHKCFNRRKFFRRHKKLGTCYIKRVYNTEEEIPKWTQISEPTGQHYYKCQVPGCPIKTKKLAKIKTHLEAFHLLDIPINRKYVCEICKESSLFVSFISKGKLWYHNETTHNKQQKQRYACRNNIFSCAKTYIDRTNVRRHQRKCDFCPNNPENHEVQYVDSDKIPNANLLKVNDYPKGWTKGQAFNSDEECVNPPILTQKQFEDSLYANLEAIPQWKDTGETITGKDGREHILYRCGAEGCTLVQTNSKTIMDRHSRRVHLPKPNEQVLECTNEPKCSRVFRTEDRKNTHNCIPNQTRKEEKITPKKLKEILYDKRENLPEWIPTGRTKKCKKGTLLTELQCGVEGCPVKTFHRSTINNHPRRRHLPARDEKTIPCSKNLCHRVFRRKYQEEAHICEVPSLPKRAKYDSETE